MTKFLSTVGHWIVLLAGIGAVAGLAAINHLTSAATGFIGAVTGLGVGGGIVANAQSASKSTSTPATPAPSRPVAVPPAANG